MPILGKELMATKLHRKDWSYEKGPISYFSQLCVLYVTYLS